MPVPTIKHRLMLDRQGAKFRSPWSRSIPVRHAAPPGRRAARTKTSLKASSVVILLVYVGLGALIVGSVTSLSPWPFWQTIRHFAAAPNCDAARLFQLAPARRGEPGYWLRHDGDFDGIACEPYSRRSVIIRFP